MVKKLRNIIVGNINYLLGWNEEVSNPRMDICDRCEYEKLILKFGKICSQCGCILKAKTTIEDEHCDLNKW